MGKNGGGQPLFVLYNEAKFAVFANGLRAAFSQLMFSSHPGRGGRAGRTGGGRSSRTNGQTLQRLEA